MARKLHTHHKYLDPHITNIAHAVTFEGNVTIEGSLTWADAVTDNLILKGRVATGSAAGAALTLDANYLYAEGVFLRYSVTDWTGVGSDFKAMYIRAEANTATAAGKSVYGTQVYGCCNNVTMTTGSLWGTLTYAYVKGVGAVTVNNMYAGQFELTWDASRTADCTITTEASVLLAKVTGGRVADYAKIHGLIIRLGEMDGDDQKFGKGIRIEDDSAMSGTSTLTVGLDIAIGCDSGIILSGTTTTAITLSGDATTGISITNGMSATNVISIAATASTAGINITGDCTVGVQIESQTTAAIGFGASDGKIVDAAASVTFYGGNTTGDALILQGNSTDATEKITITGATGVTIGGALTTSGKMAFGGVTDWGAGLTGVHVDGTGYDWASQTIARVSSDLNSCAAAAAYHAMSVIVSQTNANSVFGTWTELYVGKTAVTTDFTGSDNYAAIWGNMELAGTITSTDSDDFMSALHGSITTPTGYTNNTAMCGCHVDSNVNATLTNNGRFSAFECKKTAGTRDWDYGIYLANVQRLFVGTATLGADTTALSGFDITVTDALTSASGYTKGLSVAVNSSGTKTGSAHVNGIACEHVITGAIPGCAFAMAAFSLVNAAVAVGNLGGFEIYMDDCHASATVGESAALWLGMDNGEDKPTTIEFIRCQSHGGTIDHVINIVNCNVTNLLRINTGGGVVTTPYGAAVSACAGSDASLKIDVNGSPMYLPLYDSLSS